MRIQRTMTIRELIDRYNGDFKAGCTVDDDFLYDRNLGPEAGVDFTVTEGDRFDVASLDDLTVARSPIGYPCGCTDTLDCPEAERLNAQALRIQRQAEHAKTPAAAEIASQARQLYVSHRVNGAPISIAGQFTSFTESPAVAMARIRKLQEYERPRLPPPTACKPHIACFWPH